MPVPPSHNENSIESKLAQEPIALPGSPFWEIFQDFGRDELIALVINTLGVGALSTVTSDQLLLSVAGPVLEKIGFFVHSSQEALQVYSTTAPDQRKPKTAYFTDALKNGLPNLFKDLIAHDPFYTALMLLSIQRFPETPVWMLSFIAFLLSIGAVTGVEVAAKEALYHSRIRQIERQGFTLEQHLESRFVIRNANAQEILVDLQHQFGLGEIHYSTYQDIYYPTNLQAYNSRTPIVRHRKRTEGDTKSEELQIVYTRAGKMASKNPDQYNYFPTSKDKCKLPWGEKAEQYLRTITTDSAGHHVTFTRSYAHIPGVVLVSTDEVSDALNPYTVVEVKAFRNNPDAVNTLLTIMRTIMSRYEVVQTTHSKRALTSLR